MPENKWLKEARIQAGIKSQDELAVRLQLAGIDVGRAAVSHWENGRHAPPLHDPDFRRILADTLRIDVRTLLRIAGYEVTEVQHSEIAERVAYVVDRLSPQQQKLALKIVEQMLDSEASV